MPVKDMQQDKDTKTDVVKRRRFNGLTIEERQAERKEKLLAAALELYGTYDFYQVKIKDICREAKLTERYFYESFDGAEALFATVFFEQVDKLNQQIFASFIGVDGAEQTTSAVERTVMGFLNTIRQDKRMANVLYANSSMVFSGENAESQLDVYARLSNMIENILTMTLLHGGQLSNVGRLAIAGFSGYITHVSYKWVKRDFVEPIEQVALVILELTTHFLHILSDDQNPLRVMLVAEK